MEHSRIISIQLGVVNSFLIQSARSILVDSGYPGSATKIMRKLAVLGVHPQSISLILLTHGHIDHYGSAADLRKKTGAPIALHQLDAPYVRKGIEPPLHPTGMAGRFMKPILTCKRTSEDHSLEPDILIAGEMSLKEFGINGRVIPTPGHTPGSVSIVLRSGEAIVGDLIMGGFLRRTQPNYPLFAEDSMWLVNSIKTIMRAQPQVIYSSHGGPFYPETFSRIQNLAVAFP